MRTRANATGVLLATTTALAWGGQFVVGKSALGRVDAFPLSAIRYAVAVLLCSQSRGDRGAGALRLEGRGLRLFWLGSLGFAGFNLLAYTGLQHARPQSASLIVALGPLITAFVLWRREGKGHLRQRSGWWSRARRGRAGGHTGIPHDRGRLVGWGDGSCCGSVQLRDLQARRSGVADLLAPPLHGADRSARLDHDPRRRLSLPRQASSRCPRRINSGRCRRRSPTWPAPAPSSRCSRGTRRSACSASRTPCCSAT